MKSCQKVAKKSCRAAFEYAYLYYRPQEYLYVKTNYNNLVSINT